MRRVLPVVACLLAACGGDGPATPDAAAPLPPDAAPAPDAAAAACRELDTPTNLVPVHLTGSLSGTGADLEAPSSCDRVDAPFGTESQGLDRVVRVGGLVAGAEYAVRLASGGDLSFYVLTGCGGATGPTAADCRAFVDAESGPLEVGTFVADGPIAWVVIDHYDTRPPLDPSFVLEVYPSECGDDDACGGASPTCVDHRCVECASSFDCPSPARPVCSSASHTCGEGGGSCSNDDAFEDADDGPAGAVTLAPAVGTSVSHTAAICDQPATERDFARFTVTSPGEHWRLELAWTGGDDLDLRVLDAAGRTIGLSFFEQPEAVNLTYLAPGTYYVEVDDFDPSLGPAAAYTLTATRQGSAGCTSTADCADDYRNQIYRGACDAGSCVAIDRPGQVAEGGACDSQSDCVSGTTCPSFFFVADADTRMTCGRYCDGDADCAPLGADFVCTTYLASGNLCVERCTSDAQCPTTPAPPVTPPWDHLRCQVATGRCLP
jgi:hypothetical protein